MDLEVAAVRGFQDPLHEAGGSLVVYASEQQGEQLIEDVVRGVSGDAFIVKLPEQCFHLLVVAIPLVPEGGPALRVHGNRSGCQAASSP